MTRSTEDAPVIFRVAAWADLPSVFALVIGAWTSAVGWRTGAFVMLAGFLGRLASHTTVAIVGYRRVMSQPWPKVQPLEDDEWDD